MDRFDIIIKRQEQLEVLIKECGFMPFFRNGIEGFSIEEISLPELLFGDDFEYFISKKGEPYGWGAERYCTPEAMYPDLFPLRDRVEGRTPRQSRKRIIDHLQRLFPDVEKQRLRNLSSTTINEDKD